MRFLLTAFTFMLFIVPALESQTVAEAARDLKPKLIEMRRDFHQNPELSNREVRTGRVIGERLKALGIPTQTGIGGNGVIATITGKQPGRVIAVRADIDALPIEEIMDVPYKSKNKGVKHACGHDAHITVGLGLAELLWKRKDTFNGTVHVIFQPAEEGPPVGEEGGAPLMMKEGVLDRLKPEVMFALHAMPTLQSGQVSFTSGAQMASADRFHITVIGKGTHGATPHMGIDPIVTASQIVLALQTIDSRRIDPLEPVVVTVGALHAGTRFNVIPDKAEMDGTVRTLSPTVREKTLALITSMTEGIAAAAGGEAKVVFDLGIPVLRNDAALSIWSEISLKKHLGADAVFREAPRMIAEDFAFFADAVPSFYFFLGVGNKAKGITGALHSADFDIDEDSLVVGTNAMTSLVLDYLAIKRDVVMSKAGERKP